MTAKHAVAALDTDAQSDAHSIAKAAAGSRRERRKIFALRVAFGLGVLAVWQGISGTLVDPFWISSPYAVGTRLADQIATGSLWHHVEITLLETVVGYVLGAILGIAVGLALGLSPTAARVLDPYILAVNSLPKIALAPLIIVWFGIGLTSKIFLVMVVVFFLVFYNTYAGALDVDNELKDVSRLMGATKRQMVSKIILPSALIWIFTGMKISVPYALVAAVVGEIMASNRGIGYLIQYAAGQFDTAGVFAALFVLMVISTLFNALLKFNERFFLRWKGNS